LRKLVEIWEILDFPCGKRFKAIIEEAVDINSKIRKTPVENVKKHREKLWTNI
jgi:hypothetical protein